MGNQTLLHAFYQHFHTIFKAQCDSLYNCINNVPDRKKGHFLRLLLPKEILVKTMDGKRDPSNGTLRNITSNPDKNEKRGLIAEYLEKHEDDVEDFWRKNGLWESLNNLNHDNANKSMMDYYWNKRDKCSVPKNVKLLQREKEYLVFDVLTALLIEQYLHTFEEEKQCDFSYDSSDNGLFMLKIKRKDSYQKELAFFNSIQLEIGTEHNEGHIVGTFFQLFLYAVKGDVPNVDVSLINKSTEIRALVRNLPGVTMEHIYDYILKVVLLSGTTGNMGVQTILNEAAKKNPLAIMDAAECYYYNTNNIAGINCDFQKAYNYYLEIWNDKIKYPLAGWSIGYMIQNPDVAKHVEPLKNISTDEREKRAFDCFLEAAKLGCPQAFNSLGNYCTDNFLNKNCDERGVSRQIWDELICLLSELSDEESRFKGIPYKARHLPCVEIYRILSYETSSGFTITIKVEKNGSVQDAGDVNAFYELLNKQNIQSFQLQFLGKLKSNDFKSFASEMRTFLNKGIFETFSSSETTYGIYDTTISGISCRDQFGHTILEEVRQELYRLAALQNDPNGINNLTSMHIKKLIKAEDIYRDGAIPALPSEEEIQNSRHFGELVCDSETKRQYYKETISKMRKSIQTNLKRMNALNYPNGENLYGIMLMGYHPLENPNRKIKVFDQKDPSQAKEVLKKAAQRPGSLRHIWAKVNYVRCLLDTDPDNSDIEPYLKDAIQCSKQELERSESPDYHCFVSAAELSKKIPSKGMDNPSRPEINDAIYSVLGKMYTRAERNGTLQKDSTFALRLLGVIIPENIQYDDLVENFQGWNEYFESTATLNREENKIKKDEIYRMKVRYYNLVFACYNQKSRTDALKFIWNSSNGIADIKKALVSDNNNMTSEEQSLCRHFAELEML